VIALLREGLNGPRAHPEVEEIRGEFLAIDTALGALQAGRPVPGAGRPGRLAHLTRRCADAEGDVNI
jgi:cyanophycin synthetase